MSRDENLKSIGAFLLTLALGGAGALVQDHSDIALAILAFGCVVAAGFTFLRFGETYARMQGRFVGSLAGERAGRLVESVMAPAYRFFALFCFASMAFAALVALIEHAA